MSIYLKSVTGLSLNFKFNTLKFKLTSVELLNPLLMIIMNSDLEKEANKYKKNYQIRMSLNFSIIIMDMVNQINALIEDHNKLDPYVQAFYNLIFNYFNYKVPKIIYKNAYKIHNFRYFK